MFIELTDHLRCPAEHDESYLVLLPDRMEDRSVREGRLGCPVCGRTYMITDGVLDVGGAGSPEPGPTLLTAEAATAFIGLSGPGGYLVLVGGPAAAWRDVAERNHGVALVAVNPPADVRDEPGLSVLRGEHCRSSRARCGGGAGKALGGRPCVGARGRAGGAAGPSHCRGRAGTRRDRDRADGGYRRRLGGHPAPLAGPTAYTSV